MLFVCTGNICRSPIAERLVAAHVMESRDEDLSVSSAGTRAVVGHPIHDKAAQILAELGGDPSGFAARQLKPKLVAEADLILAMTHAHRDLVLEMSPQKMRSTFTLSEASHLAGRDDARGLTDLPSLRPFSDPEAVYDIADPIGQGMDVFDSVGRQIAELLAPILDLYERS